MWLALLFLRELYWRFKLAAYCTSLIKLSKESRAGASFLAGEAGVAVEGAAGRTGLLLSSPGKSSKSRDGLRAGATGAGR